MWRVVPLALVVALGLVACAEEDAPEASDAGADVVGPDDSACPLPLTFDVLDGWTADRVTDDEAAEFAAEAFDQGSNFPAGMRIACEVESANELGYLRVFAGASSLTDRDPEELLGLVAAAIDEQPSVSVSNTTSDSGVKVSQTSYAPVNGLHEVRLFVAAGPDGVIVARTAAIDAEESAVVGPLIDLALRSVRLPD